MESLLDQADALARMGAEPPCPDLTIPLESLEFSRPAAPSQQSELIVLREAVPHRKGQGWFAVQDIPAGTLLLVAKPLGMVMDWQDDDAEEDEIDDDDDDNDGHLDNMDNDDDDNDKRDHEPHINELLLLQLLEKLADPQVGVSLWHDQLNTLFPRNDADLSTLPAWVCPADDVFMQVEALLSTIANRNPRLPVKEIAKRLPLIIRYNILSVETCSELLSYPGPEGHANLSGVALYHEPSFFNHSRHPNVSRWAIGDVMGFVTNQFVPAQTELCISYIEHDVLCEPAFRRNAMLAMDFVEMDDNHTDDDDDGMDHNDNNNNQDRDGPEFPVVDSHVQNELMSMDPFERLAALEELMQQARGEKLPDGEKVLTTQQKHDDNEETDTMMQISHTWFQCDVQNLRIIQAITLDGLGQTAHAMKLWNEALDFCRQKLPPNDESVVVIAVQAALCSWHLAEQQLEQQESSNNDSIISQQQQQEDYIAQARRYAALALETHDLLFQGGVQRLRRRLKSDLQLPLRPRRTSGVDIVSSSSVSAVETLWPLESV